MDAKHYYECHITIEPVDGERLELVKAIAATNGFKVASLLMEKAPSTIDAFMTAHDKNYDMLQLRMSGVVLGLQARNFEVRRYKIEDILMDSRISDELSLLEA